jgi:hypothetical protein
MYMNPMELLNQMWIQPVQFPNRRLIFGCSLDPLAVYIGTLWHFLLFFPYAFCYVYSPLKSWFFVVFELISNIESYTEDNAAEKIQRVHLLAMNIFRTLRMDNAVINTLTETCFRGAMERLSRGKHARLIRCSLA